MSNLTELLKPHVKALENDAQFHQGERQAAAKQVIVLYGMHRSCPGDPGAVGLCHAAFDEWRKVRDGTQSTQAEEG